MGNTRLLFFTSVYFVTPVLHKMYKTNFQPLLRRIHDDLERCASLPLSMLGRVSLIKMNILPRLLYPFQIIPILLNNNTIKIVNNWLRTFIWNHKRPRLKFARLQLLNQGGMAVLNIKLYQLASQFRYLVDWVRIDPDSVRLDIEAFNLGKPLILASLPFILNQKAPVVADGNLIVESTLKVGDMIRKWGKKRSNVLSLIVPIQKKQIFLQE